MFKIAFPWALHAEEKAEREYLKARDTTSQDEIAGNVWISPELGKLRQKCMFGSGLMLYAPAALELSSEYGLYNWVKALLDPEEITQSPASAKKHISPPPKFEMAPAKLPPPSAKGSKSKGPRSASPSKIASPVKASPRKRQTKAMKAANEANANAASASLQSALEDAASTVAPSPSVDGEKVKVEVDSRVDTTGETETTRTRVTVDMPAGSPELPLPEDTEKMLETAKQMVDEARALDGEPSTTKAGRKRKVEEVEASDIDAALPVQPAKKAKVLEEKLKREKVRTRALVGVTATLAIA